MCAVETLGYKYKLKGTTNIIVGLKYIYESTTITKCFYMEALP